MEKASPVAKDRYLALAISNMEFALPIQCIRAILDGRAVAALPDATAPLTGSVDLRGNAVAVFDLGYAFGLGSVTRTQHARIVVVAFARAGRDVLAGLLADAVGEVIEIDGAALRTPPKACGGLLRGIARERARRILLLDVNKVFSGVPSIGAGCVREAGRPGAADVAQRHPSDRRCVRKHMPGFLERGSGSCGSTLGGVDRSF